MCARRYDPGQNGAAKTVQRETKREGEKERERKTEREKDIYSRQIRDCMSRNSKTFQTTPTGASSLGIVVIPGKCAISSVIGYYYVVITGFDLG